MTEKEKLFQVKSEHRNCTTYGIEIHIKQVIWINLSMFPAITLLISCSGSLGQHGGENAKCASKCSLECRHRSPAISTFKSLSCPTWLSLISEYFEWLNFCKNPMAQRCR
jgi:hypothetical protein